MRRNSSNGRPAPGTAEHARVVAAKVLLRWSARGARVRHADADELKDLLEQKGFSVVRDDAATEPTSCLGFACPLPSAVCGVDCKFRRMVEDNGWETSFIRKRSVRRRAWSTDFPVSDQERIFERWLSGVPIADVVSPPLEPFAQTRREALHEFYETATPSRGRRLLIELNGSRHMKF